MDGLRLYVSCRVGGTLIAFHRASRDAAEAFVLDGAVAMWTATPSVTAGELELYDLEGRPNVSNPDLSPDGLILYGSTPRLSSDTDRHLVAFTRASASAPFDASSETALGVEGGLNASQPEIAASCRAIYYAAADATGVHIYVAHR